MTNVDGMTISQVAESLKDGENILKDLKKLDRQTLDMRWYATKHGAMICGRGEHVAIDWMIGLKAVNVRVFDDEQEEIFDRTSDTDGTTDGVLYAAGPLEDEEAWKYFVEEVGYSIHLKNCGRCGKTHRHMAIHPFYNDEEYLAWGMCPNAFAPVLLKEEEKTYVYGREMYGPKKDLYDLCEMVLDAETTIEDVRERVEEIFVD